MNTGLLWKFTTVAILTLVLSAGQLFGQTAIPATPAGQVLQAWMAAFNGGNREVYRRFLLKNLRSRAEYIDRDWGLRMGTGGFDLKKIEEATPTTVTALLQERDSDFCARITLEVEAAEPHRILKMEMRPIERPAEFSLPHLSERELIAELRERVAEAAAADRFAGAVLVAKNGKPIFAQAYGLADRERNIPNTLKTRFSVGSINKMFTAVATLQLVQAGKVRLDDPLGKYLGGYPNRELAEKVTIGELLTNTGGTGDIWGPEFDKHRLELRTVQDYVTLYGKRALKFEPGSRWEYSNYGFILLGAVIEKVSGKSYYDYVREHVYNPAGMTSTGSEPEEQAAAERSVGYTRMGGSRWHANTSFWSYGTPAGGGYSTVGDLLSFANALRENKLLDAHYTKLLTTGKVKTPFGFDAYGFGVRTMNGTRCFGHNGASFGVNGDLELCDDSRYIVVALANMDPPAAQRISEFVMYRLPAPKPRW